MAFDVERFEITPSVIIPAHSLLDFPLVSIAGLQGVSPHVYMRTWALVSGIRSNVSFERCCFVKLRGCPDWNFAKDSVTTATAH